MRVLGLKVIWYDFESLTLDLEMSFWMIPFSKNRVPVLLDTRLSNDLTPSRIFWTYCCWNIARVWDWLGVTWYLRTSRPSRYIFVVKFMAGFWPRIAFIEYLASFQEFLKTAVRIGLSNHATNNNSLKAKRDLSVDELMMKMTVAASERYLALDFDCEGVLEEPKSSCVWTWGERRRKNLKRALKKTDKKKVLSFRVSIP